MIARFSLLILLALTVGCANNSSTATKNTGGRPCSAPKGVTLTSFDNEGRLQSSSDLIGADGSSTLFVCDGSQARAVRVQGLKIGDAADNQAGFMVDGSRHIVTEGRLVTTNKSATKLTDLDLIAQCLDFWSGACDAAPVPPKPPADLGTSDAAPTATDAKVAAGS